MPLRLARLLGCALAAGLLFGVALGTGCSRQAVRTDPVRTYCFGGGTTTLENAYERLLLNAAWSQEYIKPDKVTVVRGMLRHSAETLAVCYRFGETPPKVLFFTIDGKRHEADEFPLYLRRTVLLTALMPPLGTESAPANP